MSNDFDIKGKDTRQAFASFGRRKLTDERVSILALARYNSPELSIGDELWLANVAACTVFDKKILAWGLDLARGIASHVPERKKFGNKVPLISSYNDTWGEPAVYDAFVVVMKRKPSIRSLEYAVPAQISDRVNQLDCKWDSYKKVRNFVAGAFLTQMYLFDEAMTHSNRVHQQG